MHQTAKPLGVFPLSALAIALGLGGGAPSLAAEEEKRLETVTVISTGLRGQQRTVADSPAPIDIINSEQLLKTGRAELSEAISKLLPSFTFGTNIAGVNSQVRPLSNRSLGPAYTLVLVNGKRRHNGAAPANGNVDNSGANAIDIDLIPISAVSHIEVLKDSAAAQYGSDAVAGVINIILKGNSSGGHVEASYGQLSSGQGETIKTAADHGFAIGDGGFLHLSADARKRGTATWVGKAADSYRGYFEDAREAAWDRVAVKNGDPDLKAFNLAYNAELPLDEQFKLYSYATYGQRETEALNNLRLPNGPASIPELFPDGYFPLNNLKDTDYQFLFGGKGSVAGWDWDLSTTYGRNKIEHSSDLTINPTYGAASPTSFDDLATLQFDQWVNNLDITRAFDGLFGLGLPVQVSAGLEHRWERFRTFAGDDPLAWSVGPYSYPVGSDLYNANGAQPSVGAQAVLAIRPEDEADAKRSNVAAYLDLGFDLSERWYVGVAGRVEHYDDIEENTFSFKLNSRFELTEQVAIRGTLGSGFRAPSLTQLAYTVSDNRTAFDADGNLIPALRRTATPDSALAQALGASELDSEKSRNIGLGVTWQPAPRTSFTADAYLIDIDDRITLSENLYDRSGGAGAVGDLLESVGVARTTWVNYYTNAFDTRTRGLDLVADHRSQFGTWGDVRWSAAFNYNKTSIRGRRATPQNLTDAGISVIGHAREGELVAGTPRSRWIFGANWSLGDLTANLQTSRYGKVETWQQNAANDRSFGAKWITDLDLSYLLFDSLTLSVGGTNIFNVRPDNNGVIIPAQDRNYGNPPFHPGGGFWYTKLAYDF
ncbi:TonB-dependent receptor plug domain-containing protein [Stutzerimonas kirkiae]|uniref:TonB-dependent receptor n=1 Tax=Stutzerimonas kirkiae TaxID=2211392 RepID=A0A4Q9QZA1_9GAMM|nr:TonB-dependent receptor [Stutzerimonas kirkiae]TBU88861.1 TonB-dependent receptor [Stutzerimonas kirkiae]TBU99015.1 TonB-dependent receptor [Stutzerimonas kirkiae]TBV04171.1 TonB-dependent receptor [Stutzerimonas kirkiae]TBV15397.1 TonB-dependent receptor [Stutzerimonas kirkiae]